MVCTCYSVSRNPLDENNDTVSKIWIFLDYDYDYVTPSQCGTLDPQAADLAGVV